ncbi:hypothetical protein ABEG98_23250 [Pantoea agglomerans]
MEGQVRFMLTTALTSEAESEHFAALPEWMLTALEQKSKEGFRRIQDEILMRLTLSLEAEGITAPVAGT